MASLQPSHTISFTADHPKITASVSWRSVYFRCYAAPVLQPHPSSRSSAVLTLWVQQLLCVSPGLCFVTGMCPCSAAMM